MHAFAHTRKQTHTNAWIRTDATQPISESLLAMQLQINTAKQRQTGARPLLPSSHEALTPSSNHSSQIKPVLLYGQNRSACLVTSSGQGQLCAQQDTDQCSQLALVSEGSRSEWASFLEAATSP